MSGSKRNWSSGVSMNFKRLGSLSAAFCVAMASMILSTPAKAAEVPDPLKLMTYNLRFASNTNPNSWPTRRPVMLEMLKKESPHIIGTQEGLFAQLNDIENGLGTAYNRVGVGREGGTKGEHMAILFDTRRVTLRASGNFWLSNTPSVVGSKFPGAGYVRMVTWARFEDRQTKKMVYFLSTHFDNVSQTARLASAKLIGQKMGTFNIGVPVIVAGDFNNPIPGAVASAMQANGLVDTLPKAATKGPIVGTFNNFKPPVPNGERIDWLLASPRVGVVTSSINTFSKNGQFPSDHLPVQVSVTL